MRSIVVAALCLLVVIELAQSFMLSNIVHGHAIRQRDTNLGISISSRLVVRRGMSSSLVMVRNDNRDVIDSFLWFHQSHGHWAIPRKYCIPEAETTVIEDRVIAIPPNIRGIRVGLQWHYYVHRANTYRHLADFLNRGIPAPNIAKQWAQEQRYRHSSQEYARRFRWFFDSFGHWDIPRTMQIIPKHDFMHLPELNKTITIPQHLQGKQLHPAWMRYVRKSRNVNAFQFVPNYGVPDPETAKTLTNMTPLRRVRRRSTTHNASIFEVQRSLNGLKWFYDTYGHWNISHSYTIPNDSWVPTELHGLPIGSLWYGYIYCNYYSDSVWVPVMREMGIPDRETAKQWRSAQCFKPSQKQLKGAILFADAALWYKQVYGHWSIQQQYTVPNCDQITVNNQTWDVPAELQGLTLGKRWYAYRKNRGYRPHYNLLVLEKGLPSPSELQSVESTLQVDQRADSGTEVTPQQLIELFLWFYSSFQHWDIPQHLVLPKKGKFSSLIKRKESLVMIPVSLRGLEIGRLWYKYITRGFSPAVVKLVSAKGIPDPETAQTLISEYRAQVSSGAVQSDFTVPHRQSKLRTRLAEAFQWYHDTFGTWRVAYSYCIPKQDHIQVNGRRVHVPEHILGLPVGKSWHYFVNTGRQHPEYEDRGIPDPATIKAEKQRR